MKKICIFAVSMILMTACHKEKEGNQPQMTMTTQKSDVHIRLAGTGEVIIDWGDGTKETHTLFSAPYINDFRIDNKHYYSHTYSKGSPHTTSIFGENITHFSCDSLRLTKLDVSLNPALFYLACRENELASLDVSKNPELAILGCHNNRIISLDVSKNPKLENLNCWNNQITKLDMSNNIKLNFLSCMYNNLSTEALNALFETLNDNPSWTTKILYYGTNPGADYCNINIAKLKGWYLSKQ